MLEWPSSKAFVVLLNLYLHAIATSGAPTITGIWLRELCKVTSGDVGSQG